MSRSWCRYALRSGRWPGRCSCIRATCPTTSSPGSPPKAEPRPRRAASSGCPPAGSKNAAGHEVTATTRTPGKVEQLRAAGAEPVVLDGLDREAVIAAVRAAAPGVIVHQMTALADMRNPRKVDRVFATTNELRTRGTDNLLTAAARAGTRRVIAQSYTGATERSGGPGEDRRRSGPVSDIAERPEKR
ncbi:MAG TPA: NAD(P)H-binding protein [Streptosporangiaceae bacterium]|nr:NAD(P)H-binding protein [Streptosporangiaceae bacterium]